MIGLRNLSAVPPVGTAASNKTGHASSCSSSSSPVTTADARISEDESLGKISTTAGSSSSSTLVLGCTCGFGSLSDSTKASSSTTSNVDVAFAGNTSTRSYSNSGSSHRASTCTSNIATPIPAEGRGNAAVESGRGARSGELGAGAKLFSLSVVVVVLIGVVAVPFSIALISAIISTSCAISLAWTCLLHQYYRRYSCVELYYQQQPLLSSSSCTGRKSCCGKPEEVAAAREDKKKLSANSAERAGYRKNCTPAAGVGRTTRGGGNFCGVGGSSSSSRSNVCTTRGIIATEKTNWNQVRRGEKAQQLERIKAKAERQVENYLFTLWWLLSVCDWFISAVLISLCKELPGLEHYVYYHNNNPSSLLSDCLTWSTELVVALIASTLITNLSYLCASTSQDEKEDQSQLFPPFLRLLLPDYPAVFPPRQLLFVYIFSSRRLAALLFCSSSSSYFPYSLLIQLGSLVGLIVGKLVSNYYAVSLTQSPRSIKCIDGSSSGSSCYCEEGTGQEQWWCLANYDENFTAVAGGRGGLNSFISSQAHPAFRRHSVDILNGSSSPLVATGIATPLINRNFPSLLSSAAASSSPLSATAVVTGNQERSVVRPLISSTSSSESFPHRRYQSYPNENQSSGNLDTRVRKRSILFPSSAEAFRIVAPDSRKLLPATGESVAHEESKDPSIHAKKIPCTGTDSELKNRNKVTNNNWNKGREISSQEERLPVKTDKELEEEQEKISKPGQPLPPPLVIESGSEDQLDFQEEEEEAGEYEDRHPRRGLSPFSLSRCHSALHIVSNRTSEIEKMRRTSLPAALPAQRPPIHHGGSTGVDTAILLEAHGLVTDMLMDHAALPAHIVAGLKALATLLTPPPLTLHYQHNRPKPAPLTLSTDPDYTSDIDEIPYTGEKIWNMQAKRNSGPCKKGSVAVNLLRRMSTSTWTTTTSATGMPTLEPQPHARRRRSASFRTIDGTPGSSPTQPCSLIAIESSSSTSRIQSTSSPSPSAHHYHAPNAALQASHKSRSFSANALYASSDNRRRYSQQELTSSQRKTVCSLHPLSPSDLTHLSALAARSSANVSTAAASSSPALSSPAGTPIPSPLHSPIPSRDPSPSIPPDSTRRQSSSPPKLLFHPRSSSFTVTAEDGAPGKTYLENPDDDNCSTASTLGDGPGPPSTAYAYPDNLSSSSNRHSPVTFTLQEPMDNQALSSANDEDGIITSPDGIRFDLAAIANDPTLNRLSEWDYPIFDLELSSHTQILSHMCYKVFLEVGLFETFKIPIKEFITYFHALEMGYRDKPYHNRMHAADVLHGVFYLTSQPIPGFEMVLSDPETPCADMTSHRAWFNVEESSYGIMGANFPPLELMAMYTAAAMHDYDHPGRTNAFLVTIHAPQAILYNDRSVLENHHAAAAWSLLLSNDNCNFLKYLDKAEFKRFRYLVIEAILATDLKRHFEILAEFNAKANEDDSPGIDWNQEADRLLVMEMCIKLADINGPCKFHDIHVRWTQRIAEEFYEQGDEEERLGLPISPYMDRNHPQLAKLQESFINHLVAPLCKACAEAGILPGYWEDDDETADEVSSCQETDNDNDSSYSDDNSESKKVKRKILCLQTKHLQDNHRYWMNVIKEEVGKKDPEVKTESVGISTEDPMETIEEENNTPHSLNRSFSFEKEDSKL